MRNIDLSVNCDELLNTDPDFAKRYNEVSKRSSKNSQLIDDEGLLEHKPELIATLLHQQMNFYGFTQPEIEQFISQFQAVSQRSAA